MFYRLKPTIELDTPKGAASAYAIIDYGEEHHLLWCCFVDATGESWQFRNDVIRQRKNESMRPTSREVVSIDIKTKPGG